MTLVPVEREGVVGSVYPEPVGGRQAAPGQPPDMGAPGNPPPPAPLRVGARTEIHLFSCHSHEQHLRAVVGGSIVASIDGGAGWLVRLDRSVEEFGGQFVEGPTWPRVGACPNAKPAEQERAA